MKNHILGEKMKLNDFIPLVIGGLLLIFPNQIGGYLLRSQAKLWGFEIKEKTKIIQQRFIIGMGIAWLILGVLHVLGYE